MTVYGAVAGGYGDPEILLTHSAEASTFAKVTVYPFLLYFY